MPDRGCALPAHLARIVAGGPAAVFTDR